MRNWSLKTKTFILLASLVLVTALPLFVYYAKTLSSLAALGGDPVIGQTLLRAVDLETTPEGKAEAARACRNHSQIQAFRESIFREVLFFTILYFVLIAALTLGLGYLFILRITRPLKDLTEATKRLAADDLDRPIVKSAGGEIGILIDSFNRMQAELSIAREQRAIAERRATWQQVARTIAHEIKNPLTPIKLSTERLYDKFERNAKDFPEVLKSTVTTVLAEIDNLQKLVEAFHQYARFPDPVPAPADMNEVVREIAELHRGHAVPPETDLAAGLPVLLLDRGQIRQALSNLVLNAQQSLEGSARPGRIVLRTRLTDGRVALRVEDNGCGISEENRKRLFQPYFTTKKHGSGIGLALTERIVTLHGGKILCDSREGEGTVFTLLFDPRPPHSPAPSPAVPERSQRAMGEGE